MVTSDVTSAPEPARAVYVTPSHQHPTGGMLPISRRFELADIARSPDLMIIEDDYDSEFRYDVAPLPTLAEFGAGPDNLLGYRREDVRSGLSSRLARCSTRRGRRRRVGTVRHR